MNLEATKKELADAYERLDKSENRVKRLLVEVNQNTRVIEILKAAGFLTEEKVREAEQIIESLN